MPYLCVQNTRILASLSKFLSPVSGSTYRTRALSSTGLTSWLLKCWTVTNQGLRFGSDVCRVLFITIGGINACKHDHNMTPRLTFIGTGLWKPKAWSKNFGICTTLTFYIKLHPTVGGQVLVTVKKKERRRNPTLLLPTCPVWIPPTKCVFMKLRVCLHTCSISLIQIIQNKGPQCYYVFPHDNIWLLLKQACKCLIYTTNPTMHLGTEDLSKKPYWRYTNNHTGVLLPMNPFNPEDFFSLKVWRRTWMNFHPRWDTEYLRAPSRAVNSALMWVSFLLGFFLASRKMFSVRSEPRKALERALDIICNRFSLHLMFHAVV